jgi:hypothetical protein
VTFTASLLDSSGAAIGGRAVIFAVGDESVGATTDAQGVASGAVTVRDIPAPYTLTASFAGDQTFAPQQTSAPFQITWQYTFNDELGRGAVHMDLLTNELQVTTPDGSTPIEENAGLVDTNGLVTVAFQGADGNTVTGLFHLTTGAFAATARTTFGQGLYELSHG